MARLSALKVFDATTQEHVNTYDLVSNMGRAVGRPCLARSVLDDKDLHLDGPAPACWSWVIRQIC
jgi:hypothetical protein